MRGNSFVARLAKGVLAIGAVLCAATAWAVPPQSGLEPANNYGTVAATLQSSTGGKYTYLFTVTNTTNRNVNPYYGIKGLIVYGPVAPISMSQPDRTSTTLWQKNQGYSWWDMNGDADRDGDCIQDRFIEPGQTAPTTRPDLVFTLTYNRPIDLTEFSYGLHIQVPCGSTFFAKPNPVVCGQVQCMDDDMPHGIGGATVQLVNTATGQVVATATADANGNFTLRAPAAGDYVVRASATDFTTNSSAPFHYSGSGGNVCVNVGLEPAPINFRATNDLNGAVYFTDTRGYQTLADANKICTAADLSNPSCAFSSNGSHTYQYVGTIPSYPELGHFGGAGEKKIWVLILQPLVREDAYSHSFVNLVEVQDGIGTGADRKPLPYTGRFLSVVPFDGPATVRGFTTNGLRVQYSTNSVQVDSAPSWSEMTPTLSNGQPSTAAVSTGTVPPGYMSRTRFNLRVPAGTSFSAYHTFSYKNVCGDGTTTNTTDPYFPAAP